MLLIMQSDVTSNIDREGVWHGMDDWWWLQSSVESSSEPSDVSIAGDSCDSDLCGLSPGGPGHQPVRDQRSEEYCFMTDSNCRWPMFVTSTRPTPTNKYLLRQNTNFKIGEIPHTPSLDHHYISIPWGRESGHWQILIFMKQQLNCSKFMESEFQIPRFTRKLLVEHSLQSNDNISL